MTYRFREQGFLTNATRTGEEVSECNNAESATELTSLKTGSYKTITDVVVPDFFARSKRGEIFNNRVWISKIEHDYASSPGVITKPDACGAGKDAVFTQDPYWADGWFPGYLTADTSLFSNLATLAGTQAAASVMEPTVYGLVELAEAKETMKFLRRPIDDTLTLTDKIRKSRAFRRSGLILGDYLAKNWLKYRYALTPLALTMQDIVKLATLDKSSRRQTARGFAKASNSDSDSVLCAPSGSWAVVADREVNFERSVRAGILYEYEFRWLAENGVSLREIPSALYELVPYSFVADWFVNLGDYIRAITPVSGVSYLSSWTTTKDVVESSNSYDFTGGPSGFWNLTTKPTLEQSSSVTVLTREPGVSVGVATKFSQIDFSAARDWKHLIDAITLISTRVTPSIHQTQWISQKT